MLNLALVRGKFLFAQARQGTRSRRGLNLETNNGACGFFRLFTSKRWENFEVLAATPWPCGVGGLTEDDISVGGGARVGTTSGRAPSRTIRFRLLCCRRSKPVGRLAVGLESTLTRVARGGGDAPKGACDGVSVSDEESHTVFGRETWNKSEGGVRVLGTELVERKGMRRVSLREAG